MGVWVRGEAGEEYTVLLALLKGWTRQSVFFFLLGCLLSTSEYRIKLPLFRTWVQDSHSD